MFRRQAILFVFPLALTAQSAGAAHTPSTSSVIGYFSRSHSAQSPSATLNHTISFSEYSVDTAIARQYQGIGIDFGDNAFITTDSADPTSPVLSGTPTFAGPISGRFIVPATGLPGTVNEFSMSAGYFDRKKSTRLSWSDANGHQISSQLNPATGIYQFHITSKIPIASWIIRTIGNEPQGFAIDNVSFPTPVSRTQSIIVRPTDSLYVLSQADHTETEPIPFQASGSAGVKTEWTLGLSYTTSGNRGPYAAKPITFATVAEATHTRAFTGMGGELTVDAIQAGRSDSIDVQIVGENPPESEVLAEMNTAYAKLYGGHPPTPALITGISNEESSLAQFYTINLYGRDAPWPHESTDVGEPLNHGGSHIGLMMIMPSQYNMALQNAFDWKTNITNGVRFFGEKLATAKTVVGKIRQSHTGLRPLTPVELENVAAALYGPHPGGTNQTKQYYIPSCSGTVDGPKCMAGMWNWISNVANNPGAVAYVDKARSMIVE